VATNDVAKLILKKYSKTSVIVHAKRGSGWCSRKRKRTYTLRGKKNISEGVSPISLMRVFDPGPWG